MTASDPRLDICPHGLVWGNDNCVPPRDIQEKWERNRFRMPQTAHDEQLAAAKYTIGELQKLIINVKYWVEHGCSETAVRAMQQAMKDGWIEVGWPDAIRAFDEQRKLYCGDCTTPNECKSGQCKKSSGGASGRGRRAAQRSGEAPVGESPAPCGPEDRKGVISHRSERRPGLDEDNATAPAVSPVGADPPWLDEAAKIASDCYFGSAHCEGWPEVVRAVLAFAAAQLRGVK